MYISEIAISWLWYTDLYFPHIKQSARAQEYTVHISAEK